MNTFKELLDLIRIEEKNISDAQNRRYLLREEITNHCHVAIGDTVPCMGWSHKGKMLIVDSISFGVKWSNNDEPQFTCTGQVIKKDGTAGLNRGEHYCGKLSDLMSNRLD